MVKKKKERERERERDAPFILLETDNMNTNYHKLGKYEVR